MEQKAKASKSKAVKAVKSDKAVKADKTQKVPKSIQRFIKGQYMNREYSWLLFNERVLNQAMDMTNPLLERCKFLSIFHSNLDEFFMVRVGSLYNENILDPKEEENKTDLTASEQLEGILTYAKGLYAKSAAVYKGLYHDLNDEGIRIISGDKLTPRQKEECCDYFVDHILPLLSPMVLDAKHPMMRFENKTCYMIYDLEKNGRKMVGVMSAAPAVDRLHRLGRGKKINLITTEELVKLFGHLAFTGYNVNEKLMIRVTRNADFDTRIDDCDIEHDFSVIMREKIELRQKLDVVRLEVDKNSPKLRDYVLKILKLKSKYCFKVEHFFDYKFMFALSAYLPPETASALKYPPLKPRIPSSVALAKSMIDLINSKDLYLSYPYDSMSPLLRLLDEAAEDQRVVSIKITIYRLANQSRIVEALKKASENGKSVTVVIELCARFDEENNLNAASILQEAGCTIIYGMQNYKVHSKIISIVLSEDGKLGYITHLGTGNYNESTSKQYTDLNVITADKEIGEDAALFFRNIAICNTECEYKRLLVAPATLKSGLIKCIDGEISKANNGEPAKIVAKMNSLTDKTLINKLIEAGSAGVQIDLIIRGICCLVPGVPGETENIRVRSIVGRFLEHSRIYCFGTDEKTIYISSADLMTRNTDKRVEIAAPVLDGEIKGKICDYLDCMLSDNVKAQVLGADGSYSKVSSDGKLLDAQNYLTTVKE